jgi:hypothetical protein
MIWEREGDILRLRDEHRYTRAIIFRDDNSSYYGIGPIGTPTIPEEHMDSNKRALKLKLQSAVRAAGYK